MAVEPTAPPLPTDKTTILLYGRSGSGKTTQIGVLAEHVKATTGKNTRLYSADRGGVKSIQPYIDLGIIEPVFMEATNPFLFLNKAAHGFVRSNGKWVAGNNTNIGCFAFESMRSFAESLMAQMVADIAAGRSIGGGANISFVVNSDGENLKVSGGNQSIYGMAQQRMTDEIWESQKLSCSFLLWTSSVSKEDDFVVGGKVLGPDVIGKSLTPEVPRWFHYTTRMEVFPAQSGKPERHVLYLGSHVDVQAGNAASVGNVRMPLDAPPLPTLTVEPADLVKALKLLEGGNDKAVEAIKARLAGTKAGL